MRSRFDISYCYSTADRAKSIKTVATVNTEATDKLIQELIQERERLLRELQAKDAGAGTDPEGTYVEGGGMNNQWGLMVFILLADVHPE